MKCFSLAAAFLLGWCLVFGYAAGLPMLSRALEPSTLPSVASRTSAPPARVTIDLSKHLRQFAPNSPLPEWILAAEPKQASDDANKQVSFEQAIKNLEPLDGLFKLYRDRTHGKLYAEIGREQLNVNFLCAITLESGIGEAGIYSGLPLTDFLFSFRRVNDQIQFAVPNVYFRTRASDPLRRSVQRAFSGSVLQTLPIRSTNPKTKSVLVELGPLLLNDLPNLAPLLSSVLGSAYTLDANKSYFGTVKAFPQNVELESVYGFSGSDNPTSAPPMITTVPDSRSFNLRVRYSLSQLPTDTGYRPRLADDRVGYFITAFQNLSDESPRVPFVRYVNRWHLEKQNPSAAQSPPKTPIVFWIENTVPQEYREAVRDGVLMWNKAFEQAGFINAIEVRQMPDNATWDPADIRYNTIRWITSFDTGFLGLGPSRVNSLNGQILDADILIDASFARYIKQQHRDLVEQNQLRVMPSLAKLTGNPRLCRYGMAAHYLQQTSGQPSAQARGPINEQTDEPAAELAAQINPRLRLQLVGNYDLCFGMEATHQLAIGSMAIAMLHPATRNAASDDRDVAASKAFVQEFLRAMIAHEVGHTLGLRHNFRASSMLSPQELNNPDITHKKGLLGSVMDYAAVNLAPVGTPQGDYFTHTIGPYDIWAIQYGYTVSGAKSTSAEQRFLDDIARRAPEPDLGYATDEDLDSELDPHTHAFDLSGDLLTYGPWQLENAQKMWQQLDRYPKQGESFNDVRVMFDEIFDYYFQYSYFLTSYVGGQSFNRYRGGDAAGRLPFEAIPVEQQRQALTLLTQQVLDDRRFRFSPELLNKLAPSRWNHWGEDPNVERLDYPIYDRILLLQSVVLRELLAHDRLSRLRDAELKTVGGAALTIPDLFNALEQAIWREVVHPDAVPQLSSLRRGLQREHLNQLTRMVLRTTRAPEDARTLARFHLKQLRKALETTLRRYADKMDDYTRAHLEETSDRIAKALDAQLQSQ